jgi:two-component system, OmpR family, heavy metal sensor histidine kinase CusS
MTVSFRTRVIILATLTVSATTAAVVLVGWSRIVRFELTRLDERLCMELRRLDSQPGLGRDVARLQNDLMSKLRVSSHEQVMLRVEPASGAPAFQSANWSEEINVGLGQPIWRDDGLAMEGTGRIERLAERLPEEAPRAERPAKRDGPPGPDYAAAAETPPKPDYGAGAERAPKPERRPQPDYAPGAERPERPVQRACQVSSFDAKGKQWRAAFAGHPGQRSLVAADVVATQAELQSAYRSALALVIPLALLLTGLGALLLSSMTMRPVNRLRNAMKGVDQKALDQRLAVGDDDREFKELIAAYNTMLERLELSFRQASRFSSDAAHELQTPLTILQGRLESALNSANHSSEKSDLTTMLDEVGRLSAITRKLLLLSQADAGHLALHRTPIALSEVLHSVVLDAQMLATGQEVASAIAPGLAVQADALLLIQLFNNLLTNALRYGLPHGRIEVTARRLADGIEVVFANSTHAISEEVRAQFFDRFYRGDAAHNRQVEGSGLGLSLAREIAKAHGGELSLAPSALKQVRMRLWLPDAASKTAQ